MTDPALPHEILREVGSQWSGHRLHYTCRALYVSWDPANYLIIDCGNVRDPAAREGTIMTSRMPNGAYHGKCVATMDNHEETVAYNRGQIVSTVYYRCDDHYYETETIVNGNLCHWNHDYSTDSAEICDDTVGIAILPINSHCAPPWVNITLRDYNAAVQAISRDSERGTRESLYVTRIWDGILPQTFDGRLS